MRFAPLKTVRKEFSSLSPSNFDQVARISFLSSRTELSQCPSFKVSNSLSLNTHHRSYARIPIRSSESVRKKSSSAEQPCSNIDDPQPNRENQVFSSLDTFPRRHIGPCDEEISSMLKTLQVQHLDELTNKVVPEAIRQSFKSEQFQAIGNSLSESELIHKIKKIAEKNQLFKSYIGLGYYDTITPNAILRNVLENPNFYTPYTPYQAEISQGRLESLFNFQTMVSDLTSLPIANASLLDEATAAGEALALSYFHCRQKKRTFLVDSNIFPQTLSCLKTRAQGFGVKILTVSNLENLKWCDHPEITSDLCGVLVQYPCSDGTLIDYSQVGEKVHQLGALFSCATDLMALTLLKPPGEFGVDIAFGNSQRFGVPLQYGGPHAAFFACKEEYKRKIPGRIVGLTVDSHGNQAYRLALQTREQHIRREKATSNICTAQALLAQMAAFYAIYHGPRGLREIAEKIHSTAGIFALALTETFPDLKIDTSNFFDTVKIHLPYDASKVLEIANKNGVNIRLIDRNTVSISFDEKTTKADLDLLFNIFASAHHNDSNAANSFNIDYIVESHQLQNGVISFENKFTRSSSYLDHPVFNTHQSETELMRYMHRLQQKDLGLTTSMIPLGSCTMKLNAATEMIPISWPEFASVHPYVPKQQALGYSELITDLEHLLCHATGFDRISFQPNSGAQGEYTGLKVIKAFHESNNQGIRNVCLIPVSAHGTNPASATVAGFDVRPVKCDRFGNLDLEDLRVKAEKYADRLACIMITYPSTFGVFEEGIIEACRIIHDYGGQVYLDGANMNAQVGVCRPADYGADVCHLNLHKTFCIPHGGGGPGMGPIGVKSHLAPFLPSHPFADSYSSDAIGPVAAAPFGSANILSISWSYIRMMGAKGLKKASQVALLNANYMALKLKDHYDIVFLNNNGMCAHEFIIDIRPFSESAGIGAIDIAKRLQDYGFHSPTMSFPINNTLMIEPTESESKAELDRFCEALIQIRKEIREIEEGQQPRKDNVLCNAPHTVSSLLNDQWEQPYSRQKAAFPLPYLYEYKFWPTIGRVDDVYGDTHLMCTCPPVSAYN